MESVDQAIAGYAPAARARSSCNPGFNPAVEVFQSILERYHLLADGNQSECSQYLNCTQHTCIILTKLAHTIRDEPECAGVFYSDISQTLVSDAKPAAPMKEHCINVAAGTLLVALEINAHNKRYGGAEQYRTEDIVSAVQVAISADYQKIPLADLSPDVISLVAAVDRFMTARKECKEDVTFIRRLQTEMGSEPRFEKPYKSLNRMFSISSSRLA
jgi:hypothetical protein